MIPRKSRTASFILLAAFFCLLRPSNGSSARPNNGSGQQTPLLERITSYFQLQSRKLSFADPSTSPKPTPTSPPSSSTGGNSDSKTGSSSSSSNPHAMSTGSSSNSTGPSSSTTNTKSDPPIVNPDFLPPPELANASSSGNNSTSGILPNEGPPPPHWPLVLTVLFTGLGILLLVGTVARMIQNNRKRNNYEQIVQAGLVV